MPTKSATTAADVAVMTEMLKLHLNEWILQAKDGKVRHIAAEAAGLPPNFNAKEVVYGNCSNDQFYAFVVNLDSGADSSGYQYVTGGDLVCTPPLWRIVGSEAAGSGWYYVNIATQ